MSGEKGANLAPKEVCMGGLAKSGRAEKATWGSLSQESLSFPLFIKATEVTIK